MTLDILIETIRTESLDSSDLDVIKDELRPYVSWVDAIVGLGKRTNYRSFGFNVISYELELDGGFQYHGFAKNPTIGWFGQGANKLVPEHNEVMIPLTGRMRFDTGDGFKEYVVGQRFPLPAGKEFKWHQKEEAGYVCEYRRAYYH